MERDYSISVAMATYNGEKYIKEQVSSILVNLMKQDEIIISDDGSTDSTLKILDEFNDDRIKLINGPRQGVIKNFENALKKCNGKYVFFADQDDIWVNNKVEDVLKVFEEEKCECVIHNAEVKNADLTKDLYDSYFDFRKINKGLIFNIIKPCYLGCCMAIKRDCLEYLLPFPDKIEMHDRWIGTMCEIYGKSFFYKEKLIKYRRHEKNVSVMHRNSILTIIKNRLYMLSNIVTRIRVVKKKRRGETK